MKHPLLVLAVIVHAIAAREVTHEDIKDAMVTLVNIVKQTEDKLERHEYREKALGEQLKRSLAGLDKRHKTLEPLKGAISRLDERLSSVETILIQKDEREKQQTQKIIDTMDSLKAGLHAWSEGINNMVRSEIKSIPKPAVVDFAPTNQKMSHLEEGFNKRMDQMMTHLDAIKKDIREIKEKQAKSGDECKKNTLDEQILSKHLTDAERLLVKFDAKLADYDKNITKLQRETIPIGEISLADEAWHNKMTEALEKQQQSLQQIQRSFVNSEEVIKSLPTKGDLVKYNNQTLEALREAQYDINSNCERSATKIISEISAACTDGKELQESIKDAIMGLSNFSGQSSDAQGYEKVQNELQTLSKIERVMIQTAENVLDMKKRLEYGIHQMVREVDTSIRNHNKEINSTLYSKIDDVHTSILENQTVALTNISKKIESEISQVWRQIGIMYQQLETSNKALNSLQAQTEQYVNGTVGTMEGMEGKVGLINARMLEVDDNLNYLLGRLSLITQEFNQIKTGLGKALDEIKSTFLDVQSKIKETKDIGPGPHFITDDEGAAGK